MNENFKSGMKGVGKVLLIIYLTLATIAGVVFGYLYISQKNASAGGSELSITDAGKLVKMVADDLGITAKYGSSTTSSNKLKSEPLSLEYKPFNENSIPVTSYTETDLPNTFIWYASNFLENKDTEYNTYYKNSYDISGIASNIWFYAISIDEGVEVHIYEETLEMETIMRFVIVNGPNSDVWKMEVFSNAPFIQYHGNGKGVGYIKAEGKDHKTTEFYYCATMTHYWSEEPFQDMENLTMANVKEFTLMEYSVENQNCLDTSSITDEEKIQKTKDTAKIIGVQNFMNWNTIYEYEVIEII